VDGARAGQGPELAGYDGVPERKGPPTWQAAALPGTAGSQNVYWPLKMIWLASVSLPLSTELSK
jgi:hypothetical protein